MTAREIHWRPSFGDDTPPVTDFTCYDSERPIGRVYRVPGGQYRGGDWYWTMTASAAPGAPPFQTYGHEDSRGAAGRKLVEVYEQWDAWRIKPSPWDDPMLISKLDLWHPRYREGGEA